MEAKIPEPDSVQLCEMLLSLPPTSQVIQQSARDHGPPPHVINKNWEPIIFSLSFLELKKRKQNQNEFTAIFLFK